MKSDQENKKGSGGKRPGAGRKFRAGIETKVLYRRVPKIIYDQCAEAVENVVEQFLKSQNEPSGNPG